MKRRTFLHTSALTVILVLASCGVSDYASQLRVILAASTPLINSLNLGDKRAAVVADFADLASGAATLSDDLKTCSQDKACKVTAIERFEHRFWDVERRGHFKLSPKLQNIQGILAGVIQAAKLYYGARPPGTASEPMPSSNPEKVLNDRLAELKAAMRQ